MTLGGSPTYRVLSREITPLSSQGLFYFKMLSKMIIYLLILFFVIVLSTVVHELTHQYDFNKIEQVCFFGYEKEEELLNSAFGWNKATEYWHRDEKLPIITTFSYIIISTILLLILLKKELYGGKMEENNMEVKPEEEEAKLVHQDDNGKLLYGYSQQNLDELVKQQKKNNVLITMLIATLFLFFVVLAYVVYRFEAGNILANIVARRVC